MRRDPATEAQVIEALDAAGDHPDASTRNLSAITHLSRDSINRLLAKQRPVVEALRQVKRDEIMGGWQWLYLDSLDKLQSDPKITWSDRRNAAVTMGIATEKVLLLAGQPTQIVGHLHEVRAELGPLAARLLEVTKAIGGPARVIEGERG